MSDTDREIQKLHARIAKQLIALRKRTHKGLSVREFARVAGLSHSHVARMEGRLKQTALKSGKESSPTIARLFRHISTCKKSLVGFFAEVERKQYSIVLNPTHNALHEKLQELLESDARAEHLISEKLRDVKARLEFEAREETNKKRKAV